MKKIEAWLSKKGLKNKRMLIRSDCLCLIYHLFIFIAE